MTPPLLLPARYSTKPFHVFIESHEDPREAARAAVRRAMGYLQTRLGLTRELATCPLQRRPRPQDPGQMVNAPITTRISALICPRRFSIERGSPSCQGGRSMDAIESKLQELGLAMPPPPTPGWKLRALPNQRKHALPGGSHQHPRWHGHRRPGGKGPDGRIGLQSGGSLRLEHLGLDQIGPGKPEPREGTSFPERLCRTGCPASTRAPRSSMGRATCF